MSELCDIVEDSVASLLVQQPLANKNTGRGGVEFAAAQYAVAVPHAVLERSVVNLAAGVPADRWRMFLLSFTMKYFPTLAVNNLCDVSGLEINNL